MEPICSFSTVQKTELPYFSYRTHLFKDQIVLAISSSFTTHFFVWIPLLLLLGVGGSSLSLCVHMHHEEHTKAYIFSAQSLETSWVNGAAPGMGRRHRLFCNLTSQRSLFDDTYYYKYYFRSLKIFFSLFMFIKLFP